MAKASLVAVKTASLLELQTAQNDRIEAKLDRLLELAGGNSKPANTEEPAEVAAPVEPAPEKPVKPAKVAALK